jgi:tetratricopeptide (TPR) repeat protein
MTSPSLWSRLKDAHLLRVLVIYLAAAWVVLQIVGLFIETMDLPRWTMPWTLVLLFVGLVVVLATAWIQSHPLMPQREAADEVPSDWEVDLGEIKESVARGRLPHLNWMRAILGGAFAFSLLFGFAGLYVVIQDRGRTFSPTEAIAEGAAPGIAVLPFTVQGEGLDVWREGMVSLLSTGLDGAAGLRAIDNRTVLSRWDEHVPDTSTADLATALEVARVTRASYAVVGSAVAIGRDVRLVADVYDVANGQSLGRAQAEGAPDSVYALVDKLSFGVLRTILKAPQEELPRLDLARVTTSSLSALKAFLDGESFFRRSNFEAAIPAYQRAVEADSTFALALARLAFTYGWTENVNSDLFAQYMERAARHSGRLTEREAILVQGNLAVQRGVIGGIEPLQQGVRKYPDDVEMWYMLGETYTHLGDQDLVDPSQELEAYRRAIELDPGFSPAYIHAVEEQFYQADSAGAAELIARYGQQAKSGGFKSYDRAFRNAFSLLWGNEAERTEARIAVDGLAVSEQVFVTRYAFHPRFLPVAAELAAKVSQRDDATLGAIVNLLWVGIVRGRSADALAALDHSISSPGFRENGLLEMHVFGLSLPDDALVEATTFSSADTVPTGKPLAVAARAIDQRRRVDYEEAVAHADRDAKRFLAEGDSTSYRFTLGMIRAMEGYAAWRRGNRDEAWTLLEVARREATGHPPRITVNAVIRMWQGEIALETSRFREAVRLFRSFDVRALHHRVARRRPRVAAEGGRRAAGDHSAQRFAAGVSGTWCIVWFAGSRQR